MFLILKINQASIRIYIESVMLIVSLARKYEIQFLFVKKLAIVLPKMKTK